MTPKGRCEVEVWYLSVWKATEYISVHKVVTIKIGLQEKVEIFACEVSIVYEGDINSICKKCEVSAKKSQKNDLSYY